MGFCSDDEYEEFMHEAPKFEEMLVTSGIRLLKFYLDISKDEQRQRLADRRKDPLTQWKSSPLDAVAIAHWRAYSRSRDAMLLRTHTEIAPWVIVCADDKHQARLNLMRCILSSLDYAGKKKTMVQPDPDIAFAFKLECIGSDRLAK